MRFATVSLGWILTATAAIALAADRQIPGFELTDQQGHAHQYRFPKEQLSLLAVADRNGSVQVESWTKPVRARYGAKVDVDGVANMSAVPGFLRGMAASQFKEQQPNPVMLDWTGEVSRQLGCPKGRAAILLIDRDGRLLREWQGPATDSRLRELFEAIEAVKP